MNNNTGPSVISHKRSAIALIDGEHYLPVTKVALDKIKQYYDLKAAVFIGGTEKIANDDDLNYLEIDVIKEDEAQDALIKAINKYRPQIAIDLSDEPVLDYRKRHKLAAIALKNKVIYKGSDFRFNPPQLEEILSKKSISIIGTGKRVGKTAISAHISRILKENYDPVVIAMGRGGPKDPEILQGDKLKLTPEYLLEQAQKGKHAASDYYEDALMSRVKTIGCRRAGGGLAGQPYISNVIEGAKIANETDNDLVILEGSGSTIPPVKADKNILVIGAYQNLEDIGGYFGPYRLMISDLIILTMCEEPQADETKINAVIDEIRKTNKSAKIIRTVFRPKPLGDVAGKKVFVATTAKAGFEQMRQCLEEYYKAEVVAISNHLSNRPLLREAINEANDFDVMITELKAAAVDVATKVAFDLGKEVIYMDNEPRSLEASDIKSYILDFVSDL